MQTQRAADGFVKWRRVVAVSGTLLEEALHDRGTGTGGGSDTKVQVAVRSGWRCSSETPMLLSHGTRDENLSIEVARRCGDRLKQALGKCPRGAQISYSAVPRPSCKKGPGTSRPKCLGNVTLLDCIFSAGLEVLRSEVCFFAGADLVTWREYDKAHEMLAKPPEVHDLMAFMAKHLTIRGPLPGEQGHGPRGGLYANREDLVEIRDPSIIRSVLLGEAGGGDLHVYQD